MGKAFVAKLAKQGARDPEALAAWIGRKKHGKAFAKLSAKGRKDSGGSTTSTPRKPADSPARAALPSPEERRAAGIASIAAANARAAEQARQEQAERRQRNAAALERINGAPGKVTRKAMTPEERKLVNYEASGAALQVANYERLRPFADEAAQTNRIDVLKSRAFHKARAQRIKNGWAVPGEDNPTETPAAPEPRRVDPVAEARERNRQAEQERVDRPAQQERAADGFTAEEERTLEATKAQTAKMNMGQLQAFEEAYRPGSSTSTGRTRTDDLKHEAVRREIERRHDTVRRGMDEVRKLNRGARGGSFMMGTRNEGVEGMRLRRMSDEKVNRNLQLVTALAKAVDEYGTPMSRPDQSLIYDVLSALRRENSRRNLPHVRY